VSRGAAKETTWSINDGILTVVDHNTGKTHELRYRDGHIENRVVEPERFASEWAPWSYEGVFFAVSAWFAEVVENA